MSKEGEGESPWFTVRLAGVMVIVYNRKKMKTYLNDQFINYGIDLTFEVDPKSSILRPVGTYYPNVQVFSFVCLLSIFSSLCFKMVCAGYI